jgi:hypothetical protein
MIAKGIFLSVVVIGSFSFLIWKKTVSPLRKIFWPALILKLLAGISLGLVYKFYYSANDTFLFFNDAVILTSYARHNLMGYFDFLWSSNVVSPFFDQLITSEPRSLFFIKILSIINLVTFDNYWLSSLWFSFFSFIGSWFLFVRLNDFGKDLFWPSAFSLLLFPSCLFWGSGIIKESLALGSLFFILGLFLLVFQKGKVKILNWAGILMCSYVLWYLKYYWAVLLFPTLLTSIGVAFFIFPVFGIKRYWQQIAIWTFVFLTVCLCATFIHPNFYLERILGVIVDNYNAFLTISGDTGVIHFYNLTAEWTSILLNSPWALISGLFRPTLFEANSSLQILSSVENLFLIIFFLSSLKNLKQVSGSPYRILIYSAAVYIVLLCIFLSLSTPNFGTLSRYRVGFLPLFVFLISYRNPLLSRFSFFKSDPEETK